MQNIMEFKTAASETVKKSWWSYIKPFFNLLVVSGDYCLSEAEQRRNSKIKGRSLRLFNLVPQPSHHLMHIPIDSTILVDLHSTFGEKKFGYKNIAYGAGKSDCSSKGHASTPNRHMFKELKKRCRVRLVSEYRTSQVCFNCHSQLEKYMAPL
jgi:hypothetical protein